MKNEKLTRNMDMKNLPNPPQNILPTIAIPEKIIICLDVCNDESVISLHSLKIAVELFLRLKAQINMCHEYALVTLEANKAKWLRNFTNHRNIIKAINTIRTIPLEESDNTFNLDSVFEMATQCTEIPSIDDSNTIYSPTYLVRIIILYTRSKCVPIFESDELLKQLLLPYLFTDTIWMHAESSEENNIEKISKALKFIAENKKSYFFETDYNVVQLQNTMAKLLAHPLQRSLQDSVDFKCTKIQEEVKELNSEEDTRDSN